MKKFQRYGISGIILINIFFMAAGLNCTNGIFRQGSSKNEGIVPPFKMEELSSKPLITLPGGFDISDLTITESDMLSPEKINTHFTPIGKIYEIGLSGLGNPDFGTEFAQLDFLYDKSELLDRGFIEEFMVFYYDEIEENWKHVDRLEVQSESSLATAFTSHFTPFVLTAVPLTPGTAAEPPSCIAVDYPEGIDGSGGAVFTVIAESFKYFRDRDYFIKPIAESNENAETFGALGFDQTLGISTFNGNSEMIPYEAHKYFDRENYIVFRAHADIDVYVMYDTSGGVGRYDTSRDAAWLADPTDPTWEGFTADIELDGTTGRYFVETSDPARYYTVYRKRYDEGEEVHLHGNRYGASDPAIDTNYWVVIKRQGDLGTGYASGLCEAAPGDFPPLKVTNLRAYPGESVVTLTWQNPDDEDFAGFVVRRSTEGPPMRIGDGEEPLGVAVTPQSFRDFGVSLGRTYFYTVFSTDRNSNYLIGESMSVSSSGDEDGDGLANVYEEGKLYQTGLGTDPLLGDTDGDGTGDGEEVAAGTDPTNPDTEEPDMTGFSLLSPSPTGDPVVRFSLDGTDDVAVARWMITETTAKPFSSNTNWSEEKPEEYVLDRPPGTYSLYAWAKDAAGNISERREIIIVREISLQGYVKDSDGFFISDAVIRLYNDNFSEYTVSDSSGYYEFAVAPAGVYNLVATKDGFTLVTKVVILS